MNTVRAADIANGSAGFVGPVPQYVPVVVRHQVQKTQARLVVTLQVRKIVERHRAVALLTSSRHALESRNVVGTLTAVNE